MGMGRVPKGPVEHSVNKTSITRETRNNSRVILFLILDENYPGLVRCMHSP